MIGWTTPMPSGVGWIFGDVFLQNMYVTYNYGNSSVGLAPSIHTTENVETFAEQQPGDPASGVGGKGGWASLATVAVVTMALAL